MPWQKVTRHISDDRVEVESKSGNRYLVETKYKRDGRGLYTQMMNEAHDSKVYWGFVDFSGEDPILEDWTRKAEGQGPPDKPPWENA